MEEVFHPSAFEVTLKSESNNETSVKDSVEKRSSLIVFNILLPLRERVRLIEDKSVKPAPGELLLDNLSKLVQNATDESTLNCIRKNHTTIREAIETTGAIKQCLSVIGGHTDKSCWICGIPIDITIDLYKPECEHIFPIAQAIAFTGLFSSSLYKSLQDTQQNPYIDGLKAEYAWAHKICNRKKNDTHFIKLANDPRTNLAAYVIDDILITKFLNELTTTDYFGGQGNPLFRTDLSSRVSVIRKRCEKILNVIKDLNVNVDTHVANTLNDLRTYIINNYDCGIPLPVQNTLPTTSNVSDLTVQTSQYPMQIRDYYFNQLIDLYIPGFLNEIMTSLPNDIIEGITINERKTASRIKIIFNGLTTKFREKIHSQFKGYLESSPNNLYHPDFIRRLRYTILIILIKNFPHDSEEQRWSKYQTWLPGVIYIYVLTQTQLYMKEYTDSLRKVLSDNMFFIGDFAWNYIINQISEKFKKHEESMNKYIINTVGGATYLNQFLEYQKFPYEKFEAEFQAYKSEISKIKWFTTGGKRRKSKKSRSKRRKTYRKVRLF
jgi:hypothetical protein